MTRGRQEVTGGDKGLQKVTGSYNGLQGVTTVVFTGGYKGLRGVIQGVSKHFFDDFFLVNTEV